MPNIAEYTATGDVTPSDKGIQAAEAAGRRLGQYGHELEGDVKEVTNAVEDHMAVMESAELYKTGTMLRLGLQQRYDTESADPQNRNDPHFGDRFLAEHQTEIDGWGQGVRTQRGKAIAAELTAGIRNDIFNHVAAGQAASDSANVDQSYRTTLGLEGAGIMKDPSSYRASIGRIQTAIQGVTMAIRSPEERARKAAEMEGEATGQLTSAFYTGTMESIKNQVAQTDNPAASTANAQLDKDLKEQTGFQFLTPEQQQKIPALRDEAIRQGHELYKAGNATQIKAEDEAIGQRVEQIEGSLYKSNGAGGVTVSVSPQALNALQEMRSMPGAGRHAAEIDSLFNVMHTATQDQIDGKERVTDRGTYSSLFSRVGSTTNPLTKAEVDAQVKSLSTHDWQQLRDMASDSKSANPKVNHAASELDRELGIIKPMIVKGNIFSGTDPTETQKWAEFEWDAQQAFRKRVAAGQDPDKAVQEMFEPKSPHSVYAVLPQFVTGNKSALQNTIQATQPSGGGQVINAPSRAAPGSIPAAAGESTADYLKRINH